MVAVLGVTAALVELRAARLERHRRTLLATERMGPIELQTTVDPARVGPNQLHLYLLDAARRAVHGHEGARGEATPARQVASAR